MKRCFMRMFCLAAVVAVAVGTVPAQKARRMAAPATQEPEPLDTLRTTVYGTVVKIDDLTDRDGPLFIYIDTGESEPLKFVFGSIYTYPRPMEKRLELYRRLVTLSVGDRVRVEGVPLGEGFKLVSMLRVTDDDESKLRLELDEDWLMLVDQVPFGITHDELDELFPTLDGLETSLFLQGLEAALAFNFKGDRLFSYYFTVQEFGETSSQELYDWLAKFYTERFGDPTSERVGDNGHTATTSRWRTDDFTVTLTRDFEHDSHKVSWGFQK